MPQHHVSHPRGSDLGPRSVMLEGRFGRMFRNLPSFLPPDEALKAVADTMVEPAQAAPTDGWAPSGGDRDSGIPAGYTYLGQFVDHDITFDPVSSLQRQNDPDALHDFRTPRFDLDSLYGGGPNNSPYMYDPDVDGGRTTLLLGRNEVGEEDLPRNVLGPDSLGEPRGRALIGDPRNDENVIVSQLHLTFVKFHNAVVERVRAEQPGLEH
ncbi:MAG TPA: heme peroxidase, partial [Actinomycetota bacterium]|nr:heme peroxidase [Actinomycetota bacterium]